MGTRYFIVDSFTDKPFSGNPAAVVLLDEPRADEWLQSIAAEMNLSETAFAQPGAGSHELRWFTPTSEVPLCGHATLASAHVIGNDCTFQTRSGQLHCKVADGWIEMDFPHDPPTVRQIDSVIAGRFGDIEIVGMGAAPSGNVVLEVASEDEVLDYEPDEGSLKEISDLGVCITARSRSEEVDFVSRCFYPSVGILEDPVTGAMHCTLAGWWSRRLGKYAFVGHQASRRGGIVRCELVDDRVRIFGQAVTVAEGLLTA